MSEEVKEHAIEATEVPFYEALNVLTTSFAKATSSFVDKTKATMAEIQTKHDDAIRILNEDNSKLKLENEKLRKIVSKMAELSKVANSI